MKKVFILLQVMAIHLAVFSQSNYVLSFDADDFSFAETEMGYQIVFENAGYYLLGDPALPALPYKNIYILIPENTDVENVKISVMSEEIRQNIYLIKNPIPVPVSENNNNNNRNNDTGSYSSSIYPYQNLKFETVIKSQGFYMAGFSVCPFIYHAQDSSLELITEMNISFDQILVQSTYSGVKRYDMEDVVKNLIINPEEMDILYPDTKIPSARVTTNDVEYLIITSESLKENFYPLKSWKIRKGVKTEILSTNYIYSHYTGNTNQIKIKKCLQDYYENKNLKWVLLGGDDTVVPVQKCYVKNDSYTSYTPCDLFYSCFDNAFDWDANSNGIVGEIDDNIDMAPEIYISRSPIRTAEHVNTFVNKTLKYELHPATSGYVETMLLTGSNLHDDFNDEDESDAHWESEKMYKSYIYPRWKNGIKTKFYDTGTDFPGGANYDVTATNLQSVLNNGYHFVHMATHGHQTYWEMETGSGYNTANAQNQTNSNHSIVIDVACYTNDFEYTSDPCLSEAFIRNSKGGCILYWGSSKLSWTSACWSFSQRFFLHLFFGQFAGYGDYKFGAITAITKSYYVSSSLNYNGVRWQQFSQNSIGDPELSIYTENPSEFTNVVIPQNGSSVTVNADTPKCTIAISMGNPILK